MRILSLIIVFMLLVSCSKKSNSNPILASVEKSTLTLSEAERLMLNVPNKNYSLRDVATEWIDRELLYISAQQSGLEKDALLKSQVAAYRKDLFGKTHLNNRVASRITIDSSEVRNYYAKNINSYRREKDRVKLMNVLLSTKSEAEQLIEVLNQPSNSLDRKNILAQYNVDVSIVEKGNLIAELNTKIFSNNKSNYIFGPIKTDYGYHVIEILKRYKAGSQVDISEVYDEIYQRLFNQKKALASIKYLDSLRNHYQIKLNLENN